MTPYQLLSQLRQSSEEQKQQEVTRRWRRWKGLSIVGDDVLVVRVLQLVVYLAAEPVVNIDVLTSLK